MSIVALTPLKNKEEDEARKAGTLPPETDEEGRDINPHIPEYVKQAPWWFDSKQPSLKHQKAVSFDQSKAQVARFGEYAPRGIAGPAATKYRKGACANCGAQTHDEKSCLDRPRKKGAKFTGRDIKADELVAEVRTDYAGKHDPYARYNADDYGEVVDRFARLEEIRREARAEAEAKALLAAKEKGEAAKARLEAAGDGGDEFKVEEGQDNVGQFAKTDTRTARSVRDLRIREDTAKYLINRAEDAPFYDPKSHSMRANPRPDDDGEGGFMGDNHNRFTGDTSTFYEMQRFAWETADSTQNATASHVEASPSAAAEQYQQRQAQLKAEREKLQKQLLETYGGAEHLAAPPAELLSASETYHEYKRDGQIVGAPAKAIPKSKFPEDVFPGNHKSVWGSYYNKGKWGYKCCHQTTKSAYCTGTPVIVAEPPKSRSAAPSAPLSASDDAPSHSTSTDKDTIASKKGEKRTKRRRSGSSDSSSDSSSSSSSEHDRRRSKSKRRRSRRKESGSSSESSSSSSSDREDGKPSRKKVLKYLEEERRAKAHTETDERKRAYNSNSQREQEEQVPSAARMEAYYMSQERWDDPMKRVSKDDTL
jgi:pre-mRNA-processing factor SLU7